MRIRQFIIAFIALLAAGAPAATADGGKVKEVSGQYRYYVPRHIARDKAEQIALERAMIEAIANEFGTILSQNSRMDLRSSKQGESVDFYSSASSMVKGEWVETIGEPKFGIQLDDGEIVVTCEVKGRARQVARARAELDVRVLRNGTGDDAENNAFLSGDKCMLAFTSPVDGYLTVYLEGQDGTVFRMLPFYAQRNATARIEGNKRYVFFASDQGDEEQYQLTSDNGTEINTIYVVFSPNEYVKPVDHSGAEDLSLKELSAEAFRKWINKARALDEQLQIVARPITITKPIED
ncbi:MAG: DUF4384 domain-containing protein [Muribaculaceae bacterium]|nr:DUF4384 domain-containing protein [Muribaculaceae bacterium]